MREHKGQLHLVNDHSHLEVISEGGELKAIEPKQFVSDSVEGDFQVLAAVA